MASVKERLAAVRERWPIVDHAVRTVQHYNDVKGSLQAGAVTYFAFLSFFPVLALGFFAVGRVAAVYPDAEDALSQALERLLPGIVGGDPGELSVETFQQSAGITGTIGLAGVLYAGLGWLSAMREALEVVFELPRHAQPNFVLGKLRDLVSLAVIGLTLVLSVAVTGMVSGFATQLLDLLGLGRELEPLVTGLSWVIGFVANVLLFVVIFRLLSRPDISTRSLWSGALLGAVGFEVLKRVSFLLLGYTKEQEAFQVFGIALILVVWINYFSRVVMYAAAWAQTSPAARTQRERQTVEADRRDLEMRELAQVQLRETPTELRRRLGPRTAFAAGGASALGLVALLRRRKEDR